MLKKFLFALTIVAACSPFAFAQGAEHEGIVLYKQAKYSAAADRLESAVKNKAFKTNAELWNYLGLARLGINDPKAARKALEEAVELAPSNSDYHANLAIAWIRLGKINRAQQVATRAVNLDANNAIAYYVRGTAFYWESKFDEADRDALRAIQIHAGYAQAYALRSDIILGRLSRRMFKNSGNEGMSANRELISEAREILLSGLKQVAPSDSASIKNRLDGVNAFYEYFTRERPKPGTPLPDPEPGVTPVKIISTPKAAYTDKARRDNVQGGIRVAILCGANGRVEHVLFLSRLGSGLDENVLAAARSIKFEPKKVNGQAVSSVIIREYTFSIY